MADKKKAQEADTEAKAKSESSVSMAERGEFSIPEGTEPTPGVDTTTEGLAKKYGQPVPKDVKPVLGEDVSPEQDPKAKAATQEVAEATTATPTARKAAAPKVAATKTAAAPKKTGRNK